MSDIPGTFAIQCVDEKATFKTRANIADNREDIIRGCLCETRPACFQDHHFGEPVSVVAFMCIKDDVSNLAVVTIQSKFQLSYVEICPGKVQIILAEVAEEEARHVNRFGR
ncbi:hypothetical protein DPMN_103290 [Dreissena polymorpha]|uniref:Uncharacterized protein n=1 Tax=Dreissena polymorpha TaxID=45954 RepID=A0A9D4H9R8_DREPO|nr:hypothetical protein DPMN_103290 [Dreissena polymorpha]